MIVYDRKAELGALTDRWASPDVQLLLYGRRRVGKTYLLQHFLGDEKHHCCFLAAQTSLSENMIQLAQSVMGCAPQSDLNPADLPTINSILRFIGQVAREQGFALVLYELHYTCSS